MPSPQDTAPAVEEAEASSAEPAIVQYWHDPEPPERISAALASFSERNPGRRHLVFDEARAEAFLRDNFSAREVAAFNACAMPAMQADYFRYCAVSVLGGVYADADLRCVAGLHSLMAAERGGTLFGRPGPVPERLADIMRFPHPVGPYCAVSNGLFAFESAGHPLLRLAIEVATANIEQRVADGAPGIWLTAGPGIFTSVYLAHRLGSLDAFLDYARGSLLGPSAPLFCEVVGSYGRVQRVLADVAIVPRDKDALAWVASAGPPRPEERRGPHWTSPGGSIFRTG